MNNLSSNSTIDNHLDLKGLKLYVLGLFLYLKIINVFIYKNLIY